MGEAHIKGYLRNDGVDLIAIADLDEDRPVAAHHVR
jgi:hypothetical protein